MLRLLSMAPLLWKLGALLALISSVVGVYYWIRHDAYADGVRAAEAVCEAEKEAQRAANERAARIAHDQLRAAAELLIKKDKEIADAQDKLDAAADADPTGADCGIGADSVWRLNTIR